LRKGNEEGSFFEINGRRNFQNFEPGRHPDEISTPSNLFETPFSKKKLHSEGGLTFVARIVP
jgi:hypothetical protein